ncbi:hypothetical protein [Hymenobacter koreensis]|uniref:Uncharacterized protein n=1 Tax=Hymenobacter koreensis TaxID=1084523 RepID=A0ABP8JK17_9BACT
MTIPELRQAIQHLSADRLLTAAALGFYLHGQGLERARVPKCLDYCVAEGLLRAVECRYGEQVVVKYFRDEPPPVTDYAALDRELAATYAPKPQPAPATNKPGRSPKETARSAGRQTSLL